MSDLAPYRVPGIVPFEPPPEPFYDTFGLIRKPKPPKPHYCDTPGILKRLFYWLTFRPIRKGSLFRCSQCNSIQYLKHDNNNVFAEWEGAFDANEKWVKAGGKIKGYLGTFKATDVAIGIKYK